MANSSVKKRFVYSIGSNLLRASTSFTTGMLLARFLGPRDYGNMSFLMGTFLAIRQLLDMGTAQAFFTFMSQRMRSKLFVLSYFGWLALQFFIVIAFIVLLFPGKLIDTIWNGEERILIIMAFAAVFLQNSIWPSIQQALEAQRLTYKAQGIGTAIVIVHITAVCILWLFEALGLYSIFTAIFIEYLMATFIAYKFLKFPSSGENEGEILTLGNICSMFIRYCAPLILYSCMGFIYSFADTWLLQNYGGSVKQAYYAVSSQFASVALLATASISNMFYKEMAEAYHKQNMKQVMRIYYKVSRFLFLIGAIISCFLIPWAKDLLKNILGESYVSGYITLGIMFLYPIHQSMGQIGGYVFYATEHVSLQVKIGIVFMLLSVLVSYLILAPANALVPGLNLASEGLAIKMLVMQFLQVNIMAYVIARMFNSSFDWVYQPVSIIGCLALSWFSHFLADYFTDTSVNFIFSIFLGGLFYLCLTAGFIFVFPQLTGLSREELGSEIAKLFLKFGRIRTTRS